ncbi:hypothetical protein EDD21DRAFT_393330 [Dissophora ornata]|nr:hypothetical protein EDD21DRAFT_393330 [Dissophora ornata]
MALVRLLLYTVVLSRRVLSSLLFSKHSKYSTQYTIRTCHGVDNVAKDTLEGGSIRRIIRRVEGLLRAGRLWRRRLRGQVDSAIRVIGS